MYILLFYYNYVLSHLPWFETFFKMLNTLAEIMNRPEQNNVAPFLKAAFEQNIPRAYEPVTIVAGQDVSSSKTLKNYILRFEIFH